MRKLAFILCVFFLSTIAQADELIVHTFSRHSGHNSDSTQTWTGKDQYGRTVQYSETKKGYNNSNLGIGYHWDSGWTVGTYYNSYRRLTVYTAHDWMPLEHFGAFAGVATGYDNVSGYPVAVIGGLIVRTRLTDNYSLNVLITPPIGGKMDGVTHLTILKKF